MGGVKSAGVNLVHDASWRNGPAPLSPSGTVVGVVNDAPAWGFGARFQPRFTVYLSILQHPAAAAELLVPERGARGAAGLRRDPAQLIRSSG
jgi:hypothetical protein